MEGLVWLLVDFGFSFHFAGDSQEDASSQATSELSRRDEDGESSGPHWPHLWLGLCFLGLTQSFQLPLANFLRSWTLIFWYDHVSGKQTVQTFPGQSTQEVSCTR